MKILLTLLSFLLLTGNGLLAQSGQDLVGEWEGDLQLPGRELTMRLTLGEAAGELTIAMDVPGQGIAGMAATEVDFNQGQLSFKMPEVPGNAGWSGSFKPASGSAEVDSLLGTWSQGGATLPLNFARPVGPLAGPARAASVAQIREYATDLLERMNVPGAGIAIVRGKEIVASFGVGLADREAERPVTENTLFAIGSTTKAFTALGLGLLVQEGKLEWEQPIVEYLPDFRMYDRYATEEMTAIDLLTHRSGLPRHDLLWYLNDTLSRQELYHRLRYLEPSKSFRSAWQYQNLMYMTAGLLTERISGQSWEDFTRERIFAPLGMRSANFDIGSFPELDDFAYGYGEEEDEQLERLDFHPIAAMGPAGSINASAADMAKWVSLHLSGGKYGGRQLVEETTMTNLHQPRIPVPYDGDGRTLSQYALGWIVYDWNGRLVVEHGGNIDGFSAVVYLAPEDDLGFVVLANKNATSYGSVVARYALNFLATGESEDFYRGDAAEDEETAEDEEEDTAEEEAEGETPFPGTTPQHELKDYAGTYLDPGYGELTVELRDTGLFLRYGNLDTELRHRHFETFRGELLDPGNALDVNFRTGLDGRVADLELDLESSLGHPVRFEKQPDASMRSAAYLDRLVGTYQLDGQIAKIRRVGDHLAVILPGQPTYELQPTGDHTFRITALSGYTVEFHWEGEQVVAVEFHQPNGDFRAERQ